LSLLAFKTCCRAYSLDSTPDCEDNVDQLIKQVTGTVLINILRFSLISLCPKKKHSICLVKNIFLYVAIKIDFRDGKRQSTLA